MRVRVPLRVRTKWTLIWRSAKACFSGRLSFCEACILRLNADFEKTDRLGRFALVSNRKRGFNAGPADQSVIESSCI